MLFGKTERRIILSETTPVHMPKWSETKISFTIGYDIIESTKMLFIINLGCTIIFSPSQQYKVVARSSVEIKSNETVNALALTTKSQEEIPELEKLLNDEINKHKDDFTISHKVKSDFTAKHMEEAIGDVLPKGSQ